MDLNAAVREAAEALSAAMRAGSVARGSRGAARAALAAAFAACEAGSADLALLRRLDDLACPLRVRIPAAPRIRPRYVRGAVDRALLRRLEAPAALTDRLAARVDRFLAITGVEGITPMLRTPKTGTPDTPDMELTRG